MTRPQKTVACDLSTQSPIVHIQVAELCTATNAADATRSGPPTLAALATPCQTGCDQSRGVIRIPTRVAVVVAVVVALVLLFVAAAAAAALVAVEAAAVLVIRMIVELLLLLKLLL